MKACRRAKPLTAREFFLRRLKGFSKTDAFRFAGVSLTTIHHVSAAVLPHIPRIDLLLALERWSYDALRRHGVYLCAAKTLGLPMRPTFPRVRRSKRGDDLEETIDVAPAAVEVIEDSDRAA